MHSTHLAQKRVREVEVESDLRNLVQDMFKDS